MRTTTARKQDPEKLAAFLKLQTFDEYMGRFEAFHGLVMGKDTFAHEMRLMEKDSQYTKHFWRRSRSNMKSRSTLCQV